MSPTAVTEISRTRNPYPRQGVQADDRGIPRYTELPEKVGAVLFGGAETVDVQQVLAHCREQLADFKIPQYIVVSGRPLPRNPGGKILKAQLRKSVEWGAPL